MKTDPRKILVIHGQHAIGKTHTLKTAFGMDPSSTYTHTSLMNGTVSPAVLGNLLWLPEWRHRGARHGDLNSRLEDHYVGAIQSWAGDLILDCSVRLNKILEVAGDRSIERYVIDIPVEQHRQQFFSRGSSRPNGKSKEEAWGIAATSQLRLCRKYPVVSALDVINLVEGYR